VAAKRTAANASATTGSSIPPQESTQPLNHDSGALKAEQALALMGLSWMQQMAASGERPWMWTQAEDGGSCDVAALRQRLELTRLALNTGAPLSTAEVTYLMGARPGSADVERGGLRARRLSRNVWKLAEASGTAGRRGEVANFSSFSDGRRRFG
jgi:hypothetical protein